MLILRNYQPTDCLHLAKLFYETVHTVNARDYTEAQLCAWAGGHVNLAQWDASFLKHYTLVAIWDAVYAGFGDIDQGGYLDRLYVHKDYQRRGVATAICEKLEQAVPGNITVHASITAKPFFTLRGYQTVKKQQVMRQGVPLTNYVMKKYRFPRRHFPAEQRP